MAKTVTQGFIILAFFIWPYLWAIPTGIDDSMITARYSENLAQGVGFVYNQGEQVLGTTTPLWAFLSHWIFYLPLTSTQHGILICLFAGVLSLIGILLWTRPPKGKPPKGTALLLCLLPSIGETFSMGMETGLLILLTVLLWNNLLKESERAAHWIKTAFIVQALLLTRLDSVFLLAALLISYLMIFPERSRKGVVGVIAAVSGMTLAWLLFCKFHYGHYLPHSMIAKAGFSSSLKETATSLLTEWPRKWSELLRLNFPWPQRYQIFFRLVYGAAVLGCVGFPLLKWKKKSKPERFLLLGGLFYLASYSAFFAVGRAGIYPWYSHLPCFVWFGCSIPMLVRELHKKIPRLIIGATVSLALIIQVLVFTGLLQRGSTHLSNLQLGEYLKESGCESMMLEPIGYLGFHSKCRKVYDLAGLVSPDMLIFRRKGIPGWFFESVEQMKPQYIILRNGEIDKNIGFNVGTLFSSFQEREKWEKMYQQVLIDLPWQKEYSLYLHNPQK
jgi:hypothetical protein